MTMMVFGKPYKFKGIRTQCLVCCSALYYGETVYECFVSLDTFGSWADCSCGARYFTREDQSYQQPE